MPKTTELLEKDLQEIFARSSGPGGQNVNKVASRVTLRHLPTGISVSVQESRSQHENRRLARQRLLTAIQEHEESIERAAQQTREKRRRRTRPRPRGLKKRILESKRHRSRLKKDRGRVHPD